MSVRWNLIVKAPAEMKNNLQMSKSLILLMPRHLIKYQTKSDDCSQRRELQEASQVSLLSWSPSGRVMDITNNKPQRFAH